MALIDELNEMFERRKARAGSTGSGEVVDPGVPERMNLNLSPELYTEGSVVQDTAPDPEQPETTVLESAKASAILYSPVVNAARWLTDDMDTPIGPVEQEEIPEELYAKLPTEYQGRIKGQLTVASAEAMADKVKGELQLQEDVMAQGGVVGTGLILGNYLLDPLSYTGGGAALSLARNAGKLAKLSKLARTSQHALAAGGVAALEDSFGVAMNETRTTEELQWAVVAGLGVGAAVGRFSKAADEIKHLDETQKRVAREFMDEMAKREDVAPVEIGNTFEDFDIMGGDILGMVEGEITSGHKMQALIAAAENADIEKLIPSVDELNKVAALLDMNPAQTDAFRILMSESKVGRVFAANILENASGFGGRTVNKTAAVSKSIHENMMLNMGVKGYRRAFNEYADTVGMSFKNKLMGGGKDFDVEVLLEMNRRALGNMEGAPHPAVRKAADSLDEANAYGLDNLKRSGVTGAENIKASRGYVPMHLDAHAVGAMSPAGRASLEHLFIQGYQKAGLDFRVAERIAKAQLKRATQRATGLDMSPVSVFSRNKRDELVDLMKEAGIKKGDAEGVLKQLDEFDAGPAGSLHARTPIDLSAQLADGTRLVDYMVTDVNRIMGRNFQEQAGRIALAEKGIKNFDDMTLISKAITEEAASKGQDVGALQSSLEAVFDEFLARPVRGGVSKPVRRLMDYTMVSKLGQIAFAQAAEMSQLSASHGLVQTLSQVPQMMSIRKQLLKAAKTGDYSHMDQQLWEELSVFGGNLVDEQLLYRPGVRLDDRGAMAGSGFWQGVDDVLAVASDKMGAVSGFYAVKGMEQAMAVQLQTNKVMGLLKNGDAASLERLADVGWSAKQLDAFKKEMSNVVFQKNGKTVDALNLENWNPKTRTEFIAGLHRHTNQIIQRGMVGEGAFWMHSDVGALMAQFRQFPLLAIEKQTGRHLLHGDTETALAAMYGMGYSTLVVHAKAYVNSIGRPDADEYLERRLSPGSVAKSMFNYGAIFGPTADVLSAAGAAMGIEGMGGSFRNPTESVFTPPALDTLLGITGLPLRVAGKFAQGEGIDARDIRDGSTNIPLGTTVPMQLMTNFATHAVKE